jgi:hypothetical protein
MVLPFDPPVDHEGPEAHEPAGRRSALRLGCVPVIAVFVCAGLTLVRCVAPTLVSPAPPGASPVPMAGSAVLALDGRTVLYSPDAPCLAPELAAAESATTVSLTLTETDGGLDWCVRSIPRSNALSVTLSAPLGPRPLVDATTGRTVPYLAEAAVLRPPEPMAGWSSGIDRDPFGNVTTSIPYFGGPGSAVLVENFYAARPGKSPAYGDWLAVVQVADGGWHPPPGAAQRPVTVRGRPGVAAAGIIVWSEAGHTVAVLGSHLAVGSGPPEPPMVANLPAVGIPPAQPLPTDRLLAIAATLTGGGS